jgi:serine phosphatase RsbU (regulator of sigma subunit)
MLKRNITIKFWLYATATGIIIILIVIGLITNYYVNNAFRYDRLSKTINDISHYVLELRKAEKDFIHREAINPLYFETRESKYIDDFRNRLLEVRDKISNLQNDPLIESLGLQHNLEDIDNYYSLYYLNFFKIEDAIYIKGFKDYGLIGKMRDQIHFVEELTKQKHGDPQVNVHMLMLRRHEKDYLLRKDLKYKQKFNERIAQFKDYLTTTNISNFTSRDKKVLKSALTEYQSLFHRVIDKDVEIGLNDKQGLTKNLNDDMARIIESTNILKEKINKSANSKINEAITMILIVSLLLSVIIVILLIRLSRHIVKSIRFLQKYITRLGRGELPDKIMYKQQDEIAEMADSINVLTENLVNTRNFAIEVGKGNLSTNINVFDNKGDLGGSLIEMRNQLADVNKERHKNEVESQRRVWITEGIAELSRLLRENHDDLNAFSSNILSFVIKYIDAVQGAIYLINDDNTKDVYFEQKAAIAYGEEKLNKKIIRNGADLLGKCISEKNMLILKDAAENNILVSTGMEQFVVQNILAIPLMLHEDVVGVIEIGKMKKFKEHQIELLDRFSRDIAATVTTIKVNMRQAVLLQQTQEQADKLIERQEQIEQQKEELMQTAENLHEANEKLKLEQEYVSSSIRYAKTIQHSILPRPIQYKETFEDHFILFRPKDVVSGDFYWLQKEANRKLPELTFTAVVDCTGHGVPGAFMSLIGSRLLNEIVHIDKKREPDQILELLHERLVNLLNQEGNDLGATMQANNDGMDLTLVSLEKIKDERWKIQFSGAKISLYYSIQGTSEIISLKPDRRSIGGVRKRKAPQPFTKQEITLDKGDILYLASDGIVDQHSPDRKKFSSRKLIEILQTNSTLPMGQQKLLLEKELDEHQQDEIQRDDITVVGIKL